MDIISRQEAKDAGLKFYFTGKACKYGHVVERYVSNRDCVQCVKVRATKWSNKNKNLVSYSNSRWYKKNCNKVKIRADKCVR